MQAAQVFSQRPLEQLEDEIISLATRINATEYEFLVLVREFDIRQGWRAYLFNNCAEWLNFKCGIAPGTAREKMRVATALFDLPLTSNAFAEGSLSYSKARALTRVATPDSEATLLDYAIPATAKQVEQHCLELRNAQRDVSTADANRLHKRRSVSRSLHGDGSMTMTAELPQDTGELVMKALEVAMAALESETGCTDDSEETLFTRQADALVELARAYLAGGEGKPSSSADHYQVMVHVDAAALREVPDEEAKSELPIESVKRLLCDGSVVAVGQDQNGDPLNLGRKQRVVSPALRRALLSRDKCCRYPGCTHSRWLEAHHVVHWAEGGETSLSNTALLCSKHHRLLHEGGFTLRRKPEGHWCFVHADGRIIPDAPIYKGRPDA